MKTFRSLQVVFASLIVAIIASCATYPHSGIQALAGTWTNASGTVWTVHPDGTFDADLNHDGKRDVWGRITVKGDTMTILELSKKVPKACRGSASYHFTRTEDTLHFNVIKDVCKLRSQNILQDWHRK